jgi:hypothetical protein
MWQRPRRWVAPGQLDQGLAIIYGWAADPVLRSEGVLVALLLARALLELLCPNCKEKQMNKVKMAFPVNGIISFLLQGPHCFRSFSY